MSCIINFEDGAVLVSHHPISVFTTTAEHLARIQRKPDGHYDREDLMTLGQERARRPIRREGGARHRAGERVPHTRLPQNLRTPIKPCP